MTALSTEIAAYDRALPDLAAKHRGEWAVFHGAQLVGVYPDFEHAASDAVERFDAGPYLIRQIGVETIQLSSTATFRSAHTQVAEDMLKTVGARGQLSELSS